MHVRELAERLGLDFEGDGELELRGVAPLETAGREELSFAGGSKAAGQAKLSSAGCLLVAVEFENQPPRTVIRTKNVRAAFARAVALFHPRPALTPGIDPTAVIAHDAVIAAGASIGPHVAIESGARIGARVRIDSGCTIGRNVTVGDDSQLFPRVTIYDNVRIGARAILHSGCVLGADGFGFALEKDHYEKFPQVGRLEIGADVEIGANSCIDRAALGVTSIGDGTKLDNLVHIGHNCRIGRHVLIAAQTGLAGGVTVDDYAVIGGQVGIGDKAHIESGAVLGSGCGILTSKIVRKGQVVWGTPARPLKEYLEQLANLSKVAELRKQVAELRKRLTELSRPGDAI
ncbi:MAG: UDP-3-O-(3-hydroxymyristoyl)glucosamine N-acyltransferase [Bryobacteraceae bacterium]